MTPERRTANANPRVIAESTSRKVLSFLNAAQSAEEVASAIEFKGERDIGIRVAESLLDRRARLGGFKSLNQVAATPQVGEVRFSQIVDALDVRKESAKTYVIEGQVETAEKVAKVGLTVHAVINGVDVGSAEVDKQGKYELTSGTVNCPRLRSCAFCPLEYRHERPQTSRLSRR